MRDRRQEAGKENERGRRGAPDLAPPTSPPAATLPDPTLPVAEQELSVLLAMCLFGEARGESDPARRAVAQVAVNRAKNPRRVFGSKKGANFAENLRRVILQPRQFSCFNPDDPNFGKLLRPLEYEDAAVWERCLHGAQQALQGKDQNDEWTANSDHYFDDSLQPPSWADPAKQTVKIGRLNFYRLYLHPPTHSEAAAGRDLPAAAPSGSRHDTSLPAPQLRNAGNARLGLPPWSAWRGRLSTFRSALRIPFSFLLARGLRRNRGIVALAAASLLLAACNDLERTAYRTLAVTKAEYETVQRHVAEAAVHGIITPEQWNQFQVQGHRFINAHNAAVDAFQLWSRSKGKQNAARLQAMLEILPRLIREINRLVESFEEKPAGDTQDTATEDPGCL